MPQTLDYRGGQGRLLKNRFIDAIKKLRAIDKSVVFPSAVSRTHDARCLRHHDCSVWHWTAHNNLSDLLPKFIITHMDGITSQQPLLWAKICMEM